MRPFRTSEWVRNYDPHAPAPQMTRETQVEADERQREWLGDKLLGRPKGTETYSSGELADMGMFGVYRWVESDRPTRASQ